MKAQWYTLHVLSGKERKAIESIMIMIKKEKLEKKIHEIFMATEQVCEIRNGKKKFRQKKTFSGYLFINLDLKSEEGKIDKDLLNKVRFCSNVINFLGGDNPRVVPKSEIQTMKENAEKVMGDNSTPKSEFSIGEMIRIKQGPFESHQGEITSINIEKGKLQVMVTIFDRQTVLDNIEYWQVEKIN